LTEYQTANISIWFKLQNQVNGIMKHLKPNIIAVPGTGISVVVAHGGAQPQGAQTL
jgi:hypothetical protein